MVEEYNLMEEEERVFGCWIMGLRRDVECTKASRPFCCLADAVPERRAARKDV